MTIVNQICDIYESIFFRVAALTSPFGHFYAIKDQERIFIVIDVSVPTPNSLEVCLELFVLLDFLLDRSVQTALLGLEKCLDS